MLLPPRNLEKDLVTWALRGLVRFPEVAVGLRHQVTERDGSLGVVAR
jgi:hypothetical protein